MMNLYNVFSNHSNEIALYEGSLSVSYRELNEELDTLARLLKERSVVALFAKNDVESLMCYLACLKAGAIVLMISGEADSPGVKKILDSYRPRYIFAMVAIPPHGDYACLCRFRKYYMWESSDNPVYAVNERLFLLLSTSGSTGSSKYVRISYDNLLANTKSICSSIPIGPHDKAITTLPMSYTYGLSIINTHFYCGAGVVLTNESIVKKEFWNAFYQHQVTNFGGVPYTYETLLKLKLLPKRKTSLGHLTQAGGKLSERQTEKMIAYCEQYGVEYYTMYGQTEATARMLCLPWIHANDKLGSVGLPIDGGAVTIKRGSDHIAKPYEEGEIIYRGKNVAMGYADGFEDLILGDNFGGVLSTGDIGYQDADKYVFVTGRMKRISKLHGKRLSLDDIERIMMNENIPCYCVQVNEHIYLFTPDVGNKEIIQSLIFKLGVYKNDYTVVRLDSVPYLPSGKVDYQRLEHSLLKGFSEN